MQWCVVKKNIEPGRPSVLWENYTEEVRMKKVKI